MTGEDLVRMVPVLTARVRDAPVLYGRLHAELEAEGLRYLAPGRGLTDELTAEVRAMEDAGLVRVGSPAS